MNQTMQTVIVLSRLAGKAKDNGKLTQFMGYMIGALAQATTELAKHDETAAASNFAHLADLILRDCGEDLTQGATVQ